MTYDTRMLRAAFVCLLVSMWLLGCTPPCQTVVVPVSWVDGSLTHMPLTVCGYRVTVIR